AHEQNANKLLEPHASIVRRLGCPKSRTFLMAAFPSCAETERIIVRSRARPAPGKRLQIHPEKLFQSLGSRSRQAFNRFAHSEAAITLSDSGGSEKAPQTGKMLKRVGIDAILHSLYPAFIGDIDIPYWPVEYCA